MGLGTFLIVLFAMLVVGALVWRAARKRGSQSTPSSGAGRAAEIQTPVAVQIAISSNERACAKVKELVGKRFSMAEKPTLPIAGCPYPQQCECRYKKVLEEREAERRSGKDRRVAGQRYEKDKQPRRSGKDRRRKTSHIDWGRR